MKNNGLIWLSASVLCLAGFAGVASASHLAPSMEVAATGDHSGNTFYLEGNLDNVNCWNTSDTARKFFYDSGKDEFNLYINFKAGDTFKIYQSDGDKWHGYFDDLSELGFSSTGLGNDIRVGNAGSYKITLSGDIVGQVNQKFSIAVDTPKNIHVWASSDNGDWTKDNSTTKIGAWGGHANGYTIYTHDYSVKTDYTYYRFTVPSDIIGLKALRYSTDGSAYWDSDTGNYDTILPNTVYWAYYDDGYHRYLLSPGSVHSKQCNVSMLKKAIEDIEVCNSDTSVGYGAYSTLKANFYDQLMDDQDLTSETLTDYAVGSFSGNGDKYDGLSKTSSFTVKEKWDALAEKAAALPGSASLPYLNVREPSSQMLYTVIGITAGVAAIGGFFLLRKRKAE